MPLTKEDKAYLDKKFSKLPTKEDLHNEINSLYIDVMRIVSKYHPKEIHALTSLLDAQHKRKQKKVA